MLTSSYTATDMLNDAKNLIKRYGHTKEYVGNTNCGFCALGALGFAMSVQFNASTDELSKLDELNVILGTAREALTEAAWSRGASGVASYNDRVGTTQDDILTLFDEAVARV